MDWSSTGSAARAVTLIAANATNAIALVIVRNLNLIILFISLRPSIGQCQCGRTLYVAAETIRNDLDEANSPACYFDHFAVVLTHVITELNLVHQAVFGLHQPVEITADLEGGDHLERVERKALQEFAVTPRTRPQ